MRSENRPGIASSCRHHHVIHSLKPDISSWTKEQTTSWLSNVQTLEEDDKQVWNSLRLDGKSLLLVTADMLEKRGMGFGAALGIVFEIQNLLGQSKISMQSAAESSMCIFPNLVLIAHPVHRTQ